jgi:predicted TIM-barrel fold metal-dependent hydrolase
MVDRLISCDDHMDLSQLPADLWTTRLPASLLDRAPRVEERDGQAVWVCDGKVWGRWDGKPPATGSARPVKALYNAFDRAAIYDQSARRPAMPELRLADMDRDGVDTQVIFGPIFQISTDDLVLRAACYRVYNDWLLDFCKAAPDRLIGLPMLPETPDAALAELERIIAKGGVRQVNLMIANINPKLDDPAWEPLWHLLEQSGVILSWHITVFVGKPGDRAVGKAASVFENTKFFLANFLDPFVDLFAWGILERHPRLRMVMAEAGTGWLPWLVQELDYRYWRLWEAKEFWADKGGSALVTKPSDLFKRQIYATFQDDHVAMSLIPFFGEGHLFVGLGLSASQQRLAQLASRHRAADAAAVAGDAPQVDSRQCGGALRAGRSVTARGRVPSAAQPGRDGPLCLRVQRGFSERRWGGTAGEGRTRWGSAGGGR